MISTISIYELSYLEEYKGGLYFPQKLKDFIYLFIYLLTYLLVNSDSGGESGSCEGSVNIITCINHQ